MEPIIPPVDRDILEEELSKVNVMRKTNNGDNLIYVLTYHDAPNILRELGRLREISFREAGGGTGKSIDLDDFDINDNPYKQLIVWSPKEREIIGGYRYFLCEEAKIANNGDPVLSTSNYFKFSKKFIDEYLPGTIELGRSFVQPNFQPSKDNRKGLFSLDNLWDGLGALVVDNPEKKYFFGKVTMYKHFNKRARDMILFFMHKFFPDNEELVTPIEPIYITTPISEFEELFNKESFEENHKMLFQEVRKHNENIPPLVNSYMGLSPTMKTFGTVINEHFGGVEETAILVTINDIYLSKKKRHIDTYKK